MEAATLARRHPPRGASSGPTWSPRLFGKAWADAEKHEGFRVKHLARAADVVPATLYKWREGASEPNVAQALGLVRYLAEFVKAPDGKRPLDLMDLVK